jgi:hypothetical protein
MDEVIRPHLAAYQEVEKVSWTAYSLIADEPKARRDAAIAQVEAEYRKLLEEAREIRDRDVGAARQAFAERPDAMTQVRAKTIRNDAIEAARQAFRSKEEPGGLLPDAKERRIRAIQAARDEYRPVEEEATKARVRLLLPASDIYQRDTATARARFLEAEREAAEVRKESRKAAFAEYATDIANLLSSEPE